MPHSLAAQALAESRFDHQIDRALFEHARAHALDRIIAAAVFDEDRVDAFQVQKMPEQQAAGPAPTIPAWVRSRFRPGRFTNLGSQQSVHRPAVAKNLSPPAVNRVLNLN